MSGERETPFAGMRVVESLHLVTEERRPVLHWWRPFVRRVFAGRLHDIAERTDVVPDPNLYRVRSPSFVPGGTVEESIVGHPETVRELKRRLKEEPR